MNKTGHLSWTSSLSGVGWLKEYNKHIEKDTLLHTQWAGYYLQNGKIVSVNEDVETLEPWCTDGSTTKWYSCFGKQYGGFSKS